MCDRECSGVAYLPVINGVESAEEHVVALRTVSRDEPWAALSAKARNPQKFKLDVSDVAVNDRPGYLARSMTFIPTVGHGITSGPILNCSFDSLFAAAKLATKNLGEQVRSIRPGTP